MVAKYITQSGYSWLGLISFAFVKGIYRRLVLEPWIPAILAETLGIAMVLATATWIAFEFLRRERFPRSSAALLLIGCLWVIYTVAFEFLFFHFAAGMPWNEIIENYDLTTGHLFPIGLFGTLFVPLFARHLLCLRSERTD